MTDRHGSRRSERGQVVVLFALSIVAFLAVLALILDGGRVYSERRRAQNAADAAALAGARVLDLGAAAVLKAACDAAAANGFPDATCGPGGSVVKVLVSGPGVGKVAPDVLDKFATTPGYVQAAVVSSFKPVVAPLVGLQDFAASAFGVAVNIPGTGSPYTLLVLNPIDCATFQINGNTDLTVRGGSVMVDSGAAWKAPDVSCSSQNAATLVNNSTLTTTDGLNQVVGSGDQGSATPPWTPGSYATDPLSGWNPAPPWPNIAGYTAIADQPGTPTAPRLWTGSGGQNAFPDPLPPGVVYGGIKVPSGTTLTLAGGTYVMAGGGFNWNGKVLANGPITIILTKDPVCNSGSSGGCQKKSDAGNGDLPGGVSGVGASGGSAALGTPATPVSGAQTLPNAPNNSIIFYIDRDIAPCVGGGNTNLNVGGGGTFFIKKGSIIYAPCSTVKLFGNDANQGGAVIAYNISVLGGKTLDLLGPGEPNAAPSQASLVQ